MAETRTESSSQGEQISFETACKEFLELQPSIVEAKNALKKLNKANKVNVEAIKKHMAENELIELTVGEYLFVSKEVKRCPWNEKNLEDIVDDKDIVEKYRETYTKKEQAFSMKRHKKRRISEPV